MWRIEGEDTDELVAEHARVGSRTSRSAALRQWASVAHALGVTRSALLRALGAQQRKAWATWEAYIVTAGHDHLARLAACRRMTVQGAPPSASLSPLPLTLTAHPHRSPSPLTLTARPHSSPSSPLPPPSSPPSPSPSPSPPPSTPHPHANRRCRTWPGMEELAAHRDSRPRGDRALAQGLQRLEPSLAAARLE